MQNVPFVSVLMPLRNEASFIRRSVGAVLAQDYPLDRMEVIIADGLSDDGTRNVIEALRLQNPNVRLIDNPGKIVSTGLNAASRVARGEIIIRVDGHCEIASDYVRRCVSHLSAADIDAVGGPLETIGETYTAKAIAAAMSSTFGVGGSAFRVGAEDARFVDTVPFPGYRLGTIRRAGPYDEELVRNQDDEYNYRIRKLGGKILLSPDIQSRYYSRASLLKLWKQYFQYGYWKVRVMQKHPRQMQPRQFVPALFILALVVLLVTSTFGNFGFINQLVLGATLVAYAGLSFAASVSAARKTEWQLFPLLPIALTIIHFAYGSGFLVGLARFWNRWRDHGTRASQSTLVGDVAPLQ
ncbi:MAG TPA: glycosyltransferase family 2 protein [Pyrinomonadaceae bacterium]|nr:glycosyltransferase family 2 protein [Pyrinomonadaceae bacterium]